MDSEQLEELVRDTREIREIVSMQKKEYLLKQILRTSEVKKLLGLSDSTLAGLRMNGTIPFSKLGGTVYYLREDIERLIIENYSGERLLK